MTSYITFNPSLSNLKDRRQRLRAMPILTSTSPKDQLCRFSGNHKRIEQPIQPIWQGYTNGCGTASLAMALNSIASQGAQKFTQKKLDYRRPLNTYTSPGTLVKIAKEQGYYAAIYNNSTFKELCSHLDKGHMIIALHNAELENRFNSLHYLVIHGYEEENDTTKRKLLTVDPVYEHMTTAKKDIAYNEFLKFWNKTKLGPFPTGANRLIVVVSQKDDLLPNRKVPFAIKMADSFNLLTYWYANSWFQPFGNAIYKFIMLPINILWWPFSKFFK
jgi:hypothetical protein